MALTNTLIGKQQKTFRLLTEETAQKPRAKVAAVATVANQFNAGQIVFLDTTDACVRLPATIGAGSKVQYGVSFNSHTPTLDECDGSGYATFLWSQHEGQTTQFDSTVTAATAIAGTPLGVASGGNFSTNTTEYVGWVEDFSGGWLRYHWDPTSLS